MVYKEAGKRNHRHREQTEYKLHAVVAGFSKHNFLMLWVDEKLQTYSMRGSGTHEGRSTW